MSQFSSRIFDENGLLVKLRCDLHFDETEYKRF